MSRIIAGRFDKTLDADAAVEALHREGFGPEEIDSFYVSPPGQNAMAPLGGDAQHSSEGSRHAGRGAVIGAIIGAVIGGLIGMAIGLLFSPGDYGVIVILLGTGLGAYMGSFLGAMSKVRGGRPAQASVEHPVEPKGGRMIAVNADRAGTDARAVKVLREFGARDLGRAQGTWSNGWKDFDPRSPLAAV